MTEDQTTQMTESDDIAHLTADVVSAYVSNNAVPVADISKLISDVYGALAGLGKSTFRAEEVVDLKPAVSVKKSVTDDAIICLECGKPFKSLKRHLMANHSMTAEAYRKRWNLPSSYPIVAPNYAASRSNLAKEMGLGRKPSLAREDAA